MDRPPTKTETEYLRAVKSLSAKDPPTIGEVARKAKKSRTATSQALDRLARLGLVKKSEKHPGCPRRVEVL